MSAGTCNCRRLELSVELAANEDAPRYRMFVADVSAPARANWRELIPQSDAILQGAAIVSGLLLAQYEKNASSQLKLLDIDGHERGDVQLPQIGTVGGIGGK